MSVENDLRQQVSAVLETSTVAKAREILSSRSGTVMIGLISFIESALPIPILTDPFLVAAILADRTRAARLVLITLITSVLGGVAAYFMALFFLEFLLSFLSQTMVEEFHELANGTGSGTALLTLVGAVTPVPYTLVAWAIAVIKGNFWVFVAASVVGRGFRYAVVGWSTYHFGATALRIARRYIGVTSIILVVLFAAFIWYKM
ncbi:hypothetical protein KC906_00505 [Candidatus Kaiserbacteria bacterium]|nr:hypothetical protein [Candidatus Kaiserbacteria bacterium]MCB9812433.1 hypothetical protein [Candidatus Nomurabacteria bacterium]